MQEILCWSASLLTIVPGIAIAARVRSFWMGWAFVALTAGALLWIAVASLAHDSALLAQNALWHEAGTYAGTRSARSFS